MGGRKKIPETQAAAMLAAARRRCCICVALSGDLREKKGQIAHLDRDPSNTDADNLAFLCLEHHDEYDSRPSQSKGLTVEEVKRYRAEMLAALARGGAPESRSGVASSQQVVRPLPRYFCEQFAALLIGMPDEPRSLARVLDWVEGLDDELLLVSAAMAGRPESSCHVAQSWISENSHPLGAGRSVQALIQALLDVGVLAPSTEELVPGSYAEWDAQRNPAWDYGRMLLQTWGLLRRATAAGLFTTSEGRDKPGERV